MYSRKRIHPAVRIIGVIAALALLILLLGRLDFPGWVLRVIGELIPSGRQPAYSPEEVKELRQKVGSLESENSLLREMVVNLQQGKELQSIGTLLGTEMLVAQVVYRDHSRIFATAIIDKGESDGVKAGMPVVDSHGLVGRIVSTRAAVSRIELITSPECSFGVIDQRSRELGIVRGSEAVRWRKGNGTGVEGESVEPNLLEMEYLSPSADISVKDPLVTSGLSGITPEGIRVGEVVEIITSEEQGWFDIGVKPYADLEHLETVAVVLFQEEERAQIEGLLEEETAESGAPVN